MTLSRSATRWPSSGPVQVNAEKGVLEVDAEEGRLLGVAHAGAVSPRPRRSSASTSADFSKLSNGSARLRLGRHAAVVEIVVSFRVGLTFASAFLAW